MRNRWYDPETGRFLSEDPIGLSGGINPYVYAANSPLNLRDPLGLDPDPIFNGGTLPGITGYAGGWYYISMTMLQAVLDEMSGGSGTSGGSMAGFAGGGGGRHSGGREKPSSPKPDGCFTETAAGNFSETNRILFTTAVGLFRTAGMVRAGMAYNSAVETSGAFADIMGFVKGNPRMWISIFHGETYIGGGAVVASAAGLAETTVAITGALEFGIAAGSAAVAAVKCMSR